MNISPRTEKIPMVDKIISIRVALFLNVIFLHFSERVLVTAQSLGGSTSSCQEDMLAMHCST